MEKPCELRQGHKASEDFQNADQFSFHNFFCFKLKKTFILEGQKGEAVGWEGR